MSPGDPGETTHPTGWAGQAYLDRVTHATLLTVDPIRLPKDRWSGTE